MTLLDPIEPSNKVSVIEEYVNRFSGFEVDFRKHAVIELMLKLEYENTEMTRDLNQTEVSLVEESEKSEQRIEAQRQ